MIGVIDYDQGNLFCIENVLKLLNKKCIITKNNKELEKCEIIILPGVGAYQETMKNINKNGLKELIINKSYEGVKIIGICVGMQILSTIGYENKTTEGLNLIPGEVKKLPNTKYFPIPNINWYKINVNYNSEKSKKLKIFENKYFYFLHSYYFNTEKKNILASFNFDNLIIPSIINNKNIFGIQFHPEKSAENGINLLKKIIEI